MWGFSHYAKHNCQSCAQNASQIRVVNQYDVRSNNSKAAEKQIPTTSFDQILVRTDFSSTVLVHQSVLQRLLKSSGIDQERRTSISSRSRNDPTKYGRNSPSDSCAITPMAARNPAGGARPDNKGQVKKELKRVGEKLDLLEQRVDRLEVIAEEQDSYRVRRIVLCWGMSGLVSSKSKSRVMSYGNAQLLRLKKQSEHSSRDKWMKRQRSAKRKSCQEHSPRSPTRVVMARSFGLEAVVRLLVDDAVFGLAAKN